MTALKLFDLVSIIIINEAYKLSNETTVYAILKQRCLMTKTIIGFEFSLFNYVILIICFVIVILMILKIYNLSKYIIINSNSKQNCFTRNIK